MKMTDLKLPKASKKDKEVMTSPAMPERDEYPYGAKISLNEDQIKKMEGVFDFDVDGKVMVHAHGYICDKRSHERQGGKSDRTIEIQITAMVVEPVGKKTEDDADWYKSKKK